MGIRCTRRGRERHAGHFTSRQWNQVREDYEDWWTHEREKPIIHLAFDGVDPGMKRPEGKITTNLYEYDAEEPAERIAEKLEYIMRGQKYEFNAYPHIWMYFGPIYSIEFIGCRPYIRPETVWFAPEVKLPPEELHIRPDSRAVARSCRCKTGCMGFCATHSAEEHFADSPEHVNIDVVPSFQASNGRYADARQTDQVTLVQLALS